MVFAQAPTPQEIIDPAKFSSVIPLQLSSKPLQVLSAFDKGGLGTHNDCSEPEIHTFLPDDLQTPTPQSIF